MKKSIFLTVIMAFSLSFLLVGCGEQPTDTKHASDETVKIGYSRLRISLPVFVAQQREIFKKHGLDVELEMYETAQPLMQALVEGKVHVAGYTALPITYNGMLRSGKRLKFLSAMIEDENHRISYLLKRESDSSITSIQDLKGKVIGILPTIAYKAWIEAILLENGLQPGVDVVIQQVAPPLQAQSLKSGGVDALFTNDPAATSAIAIGVAEPVTMDVEVPKYLGSPFLFGSFNVDETWAKNNPEKFQKVIAALDEAIAYVNAYPEEAKQHMAPYLPDQFKPHVMRYPNAKYLGSTDINQAMFDGVADQYLEIGIIKNKVDLTGLIHTTSQ